MQHASVLSSANASRRLRMVACIAGVELVEQSDPKFYGGRSSYGSPRISFGCVPTPWRSASNASIRRGMWEPGRYDYVGILAITARTCAPDHTPPRGVVIPRSFNSFAIERSEFAPAVRISSMTGARSAARAVAARDLACRAFAQSAVVPARPRNPPSRLPRALAAARAAPCGLKSSLLHARRWLP